MIVEVNFKISIMLKQDELAALVAALMMEPDSWVRGEIAHAAMRKEPRITDLSWNGAAMEFPMEGQR